MKTKEKKELRSLSDKDLLNMLNEIEGKIREIRFKSKVERPSNPMELRNLRKKVAVIKTILNERKIEKK
ncbi:MAG: 50S ribosomal protein L29 [Brevinematales bacterium]|nr:50S ribosomal protein L29 [Brevinematales bacterium]